MDQTRFRKKNILTNELACKHCTTKKKYLKKVLYFLLMKLFQQWAFHLGGKQFQTNNNFRLASFDTISGLDDREKDWGQNLKISCLYSQDIKEFSLLNDNSNMDLSE